MNLTIALLTYNRTDFLKRQLNFLSQLGCAYPIVVLDGSSVENQEVNRALVGSLKSLKLTHDCYPEALNQTLRIKKGFEKIHTKYSLLFADDDFLLPNSLDHCISFLEKNEDYVSCCGRVPCLFVREGPMKISFIAMMNFLGNNFSNSYSSMSKRLLTNSVLTVVGQPPLYYTVKRTEIIKGAYEFASQTAQYSAMEGVFNAYTLIKGKHKVLDVAFALRDYSSPTTVDQNRDETKNGKYVSDKNEQDMYDFFSKRGAAPELLDYIHAKDGNLTGDPENIKPLEIIVPQFFGAKRLQYFINFFSNYYLCKRFRLSKKEVRALKAVL